MILLLFDINFPYKLISYLIFAQNNGDKHTGQKGKQDTG